MLQLYVAGNPVLTNMLGNMNWEQDVENRDVSEADLTGKYGFKKIASHDHRCRDQKTRQILSRSA